MATTNFIKFAFFNLVGTG